MLIMGEAAHYLLHSHQQIRYQAEIKYRLVLGYQLAPIEYQLLGPQFLHRRRFRSIQRW